MLLGLRHLIVAITVIGISDGYYTRLRRQSRPLPRGIVMVPLTGGNFTMGMDSERPIRQFQYERMPAHVVTLDPFQMADTETTNAQYVEFLNAAMTDGLIDVKRITTQYGAPDNFKVATENWVIGSDKSTYKGHKLTNLDGTRVLKDHTRDGVMDPENPLNYQFIGFDQASRTFYIKDPATLVIDGDWEKITEDVIPFGMQPDAANWQELTTPGLMPTLDEVSLWPASFIKWYGAYAFADYYDVSLPTEAQWEYAAKAGPLNLQYATDDGTIDPTKANYNIGGIGTTALGHNLPVRSYPPNPFGLYEMSGNVWEWLGCHFTVLGY